MKDSVTMMSGMRAKAPRAPMEWNAGVGSTKMAIDVAGSMHLLCGRWGIEQSGQTR